MSRAAWIKPAAIHRSARWLRHHSVAKRLELQREVSKAVPQSARCQDELTMSGIGLPCELPCARLEQFTQCEVRQVGQVDVDVAQRRVDRPAQQISPSEQVTLHA